MKAFILTSAVLNLVALVGTLSLLATSPYPRYAMPVSARFDVARCVFFTASLSWAAYLLSTAA